MKKKLWIPVSVAAIVAFYLLLVVHTPCFKEFCFQSGSLEELLELHPVGSDYDLLAATLSKAGASVSKGRNVFTRIRKDDFDPTVPDNIYGWSYYENSWRTLYIGGISYAVTVEIDSSNKILSIEYSAFGSDWL